MSGRCWAVRTRGQGVDSLGCSWCQEAFLWGTVAGGTCGDPRLRGPWAAASGVWGQSGSCQRKPSLGGWQGGKGRGEACSRPWWTLCHAYCEPVRSVKLVGFVMAAAAMLKGGGQGGREEVRQAVSSVAGEGGGCGPGPVRQRNSTLVSLLPASLLVLHGLGTVWKEMGPEPSVMDAWWRVPCPA